MALSEEFILELKQRNDIESVLSPYVNLKRRGSNLVGLCPFHNEKTPSFTVYPQNGSFYCFGCGAGGDVITFVRRAENLDYMEAVRFLAERAGMAMPVDGVDDTLAKQRGLILEINRQAARFFHTCLLSQAGKPALDYLTGRGIKPKTIRRFGLGYAPKGWNHLLDYLRQKGFDQQSIQAADLCVRGRNDSYYDRFRNRVIFPIINLRGNVIGFGGRAMPDDDTGAKYINTSDTLVFKKSNHMYAMNAAKDTGGDRMILAEGYMDVIALHQAGFENAVAALGTSFTLEQARLLSRYTKEVVVTLDADEAGKKATDRALNILNSVGLAARVLRLPEGKDPDEFIKKNGPARFEAILNGAVNEIEYKLFLAAQDIDTQADDGKLVYLKKAAEVLARVEDKMALDLYAGRLAGQYGVSKEAILEEVRKRESINRRQQRKKTLRQITMPPSRRDTIDPQRAKYPRAAKAEETILSILMLSPDKYANVSQALRAEDFVTQLNRRVFSAVCGVLERGQAFDLSLVCEQFTQQEMGYIASLQTHLEHLKNADQILADCMETLRLEKRKADAANPAELTTEQWAEQFASIAQQKNGGE